MVTVIGPTPPGTVETGQRGNRVKNRHPHTLPFSSDYSDVNNNGAFTKSVVTGLSRAHRVTTKISALLAILGRDGGSGNGSRLSHFWRGATAPLVFQRYWNDLQSRLLASSVINPVLLEHSGDPSRRWRHQRDFAHKRPDIRWLKPTVILSDQSLKTASASICLAV